MNMTSEESDEADDADDVFAKDNQTEEPGVGIHSNQPEDEMQGEDTSSEPWQINRDSSNDLQCETVKENETVLMTSDDSKVTDIT